MVAHILPALQQPMNMRSKNNENKSLFIIY